MSTTKANIDLTPVGRLVQGSAFEPMTKDADGNPLTYKMGAKKDQPRVSYYMGLAIRKDEPGVNELIASIRNFARQIHPRFFDPTGNCVLPSYSFKYIDGDSTAIDKKGRRICDHEGFPGCWIFRFAGDFAPKCFVVKNKKAEIIDPKTIKTGHYICITGTLADNRSDQTPGVKLYPSMVQWIGYGPEIEYGPDVSVLENANRTLPAGASLTPIAPKTQVSSAFLPNIPPAHDFLNPGNQGLMNSPAVLPPRPPIPATEEKRIASNGVAYTRDELKIFKFTDAQIDALPKA
jgi:hypothetical protein